jgi:hypothetical protein
VAHACSNSPLGISLVARTGTEWPSAQAVTASANSLPCAVEMQHRVCRRRRDGPAVNHKMHMLAAARRDIAAAAGGGKRTSTPHAAHLCKTWAKF